VVIAAAAAAAAAGPALDYEQSIDSGTVLLYFDRVLLFACNYSIIVY